MATQTPSTYDPPAAPFSAPPVWETAGAPTGPATVPEATGEGRGDGAERETEQETVARLRACGVRGVALTTLDNAGVTRVKGVPVEGIAAAARKGIGFPPVFDVALVDDSFVESPRTGGPTGDLRMVPDLSRLTVLHAVPGWAWAPADRFEQSGRPYAACHRGTARRMAEAAAALGLGVRMGFETEWIVTVPDDAEGPRATGARAGTRTPSAGATPGTRTPATGAPGGAGGRPSVPVTGPAYSMGRLSAASGYLADILEALRAQGVPVLQIHPEYAPGQFEVSVAPTDPVTAADLVVLVQETVRAVTARHGWETNFGPSVVPGEVGNGRHVHFSLWRGPDNLCHAPGTPLAMEPECEHFLAGVLQHLPALVALGAPSPASYLRLGPHRWAGAFQCWGVENREAALRFIPGPPDSRTSANAEVKCFDAAASPYLVVAGILAAGLDGLRREARLPDPVPGDPAASGALPLPATLPQAVARLRESSVLRAALGATLTEAIIAVREGESALFAEYAPQELADATRRRY